MNKRGGTLFIAVIIASMVFIAGMIVMNFIRDDSVTTRNSSNLDCSNSSISDGNKVTCLGIDLIVPYFVILVISAAAGLVGARFA